MVEITFDPTQYGRVGGTTSAPGPLLNSSRRNRVGSIDATILAREAGRPAMSLEQSARQDGVSPEASGLSTADMVSLGVGAASMVPKAINFVAPEFGMQAAAGIDALLAPVGMGGSVIGIPGAAIAGESLADVGGSLATGGLGESMFSLNGAGSLDLGLGSGISPTMAAGLANMAGGFVGGMAADMLGLSNGIGSQIGSTIGSIIGQWAIPIPFLGAAIGSFVGSWLGGLFGGSSKPYNTTVSGQSGINLETGLFDFVRPFNTTKAGGGDPSGVISLAENINTQMNSLFQNIGATIDPSREGGDPNDWAEDQRWEPFAVGQSVDFGNEMYLLGDTSGRGRRDPGYPDSWYKQSVNSFSTGQEALDLAGIHTLRLGAQRGWLDGITPEVNQLIVDYKGSSLNELEKNILKAQQVSTRAQRDLEPPTIRVIEGDPLRYGRA